MRVGDAGQQTGIDLAGWNSLVRNIAATHKQNFILLFIYY
jgi:hypothetical protein